MTGRRFAVAGIQLWILAFTAVVGTYLTTWFIGMRIPAIVAFAVPVLALALIRLRRAPDAVDIAIVIALAAHAIVAAAGIDPLGSLEGLGLALVYAGLFWVMRELGSHRRVTSLVAVPVALGATSWLAAAGIAWIGEKWAWVAAGGGMPPLESYQVFVWGTANAYPVLALVAAPYLAWIEPGALRRALVAVMALAAAVAVPLSAGRAGWLGIVAGLVAWEALGGWPLARRAIRSATRSRLAAGIAVVAIVGLVALVILGRDRIGAAVAANLDARWRVWEQAIGIFGADPLTGSGPGTFSWARLEHVPDYVDRIGVVLAHNVVVQTLADGGLVLLVGFGAVVVTWTVAAWRRHTETNSPQRLSAAAVIGVAAASLLDDFSFLPALVGMTVTLAAWSVPVVGAHERPTESRARASRWVLVAATLAFGAVALVPAIRVEASRLTAQGAREAAIAGEWDVAAARYGDATAAYPTNPANHLGLGLSHSSLGEADGARSAYEEARRLSPGDPRSYGALAVLASGADERIGLLDDAARRSNDPQYAYRLAEALAEAGRDPEAVDAMAIAVAIRPDLYMSLSDRGAAVSRDMVGRVLESAVATIQPRGEDGPRIPFWDVGLADHALPEDARSPWRAALAVGDGDAESAEEWVATSRRETPYDSYSHLAAAALAASTCDEMAYRDAMTLAGPQPSGDGGLTIDRDPVYRELGLGDYQPAGDVEVPRPVVWPGGLVEVPECDG